MPSGKYCKKNVACQRDQANKGCAVEQQCGCRTPQHHNASAWSIYRGGALAMRCRTARCISDPPPQIRLSPSKQPQLFCPRIFEGFSFFFKKKSRVKNSNWATVGICKLLSCSWKFQTNWAVLQGLDTCPKPSSPTGWTARPTHGGGVFSRQCFPSFQSHGGNQHLFQCQPVFAEKFWWLFDHP